MASKGQVMENTCPSVLLGMQSLHNETYITHRWSLYMFVKTV
jgi:hypothetical protein